MHYVTRRYIGFRGLQHEIYSYVSKVCANRYLCDGNDEYVHRHTYVMYSHYTQKYVQNFETHVVLF